MYIMCDIDSTHLIVSTLLCLVHTCLGGYESNSICINIVYVSSCTQVFKQYNHNEQKTQNSTYVVYTYLYLILKNVALLHLMI